MTCSASTSVSTPGRTTSSYLLQDLSGHYPSFPGGIGGVEYPEVDLVVHLAAHAKVHQLVRQPHRALENAVMTFNVLEFCRQQNLPIVFSSSREVYGDVHRFAEEEASEASADFAYTESTYSASKIAGEAFVYSYARCYGLQATSSSVSRTSTADTTTILRAWCASCRSSSTRCCATSR